MKQCKVTHFWKLSSLAQIYPPTGCCIHMCRQNVLIRKVNICLGGLNFSVSRCPSLPYLRFLRKQLTVHLRRLCASVEWSNTSWMCFPNYCRPNNYNVFVLPYRSPLPPAQLTLDVPQRAGPTLNERLRNGTWPTCELGRLDTCRDNYFVYSDCRNWYYVMIRLWWQWTRPTSDMD